MTDHRQVPGDNQTPVREQDKVMLRLPDGVRDRLKAAAEHNRRSMNAEIVARIQEYEALDLGGETLTSYVERLSKDLDAALNEKHRMRQLGWDKANAGPSDSELEARRALHLALESLESSVADQRRTLLHERYMLSQIRLMRGLLERVASTDGHLPDELLAMIRMLTQASEGADPADGEVVKLLADAVRAIENLESDE